jgi:hypothetical protein
LALIPPSQPATSLSRIGAPVVVLRVPLDTVAVAPRLDTAIFTTARNAKQTPTPRRLTDMCAPFHPALAQVSLLTHRNCVLAGVEMMNSPRPKHVQTKRNVSTIADTLPLGKALLKKFSDHLD